MKRAVAIAALGGALVVALAVAVASFAQSATGEGHGILFVTVPAHASESRVYAWTPGAGPRPIGSATDWEDAVAWSPDGKSIAFEGQQGSWDEANPEDIYVMSASGKGVERLTHSTGPEDWDVGPSWSPDGRRLVFVHNSNLAPHLMILTLSTGAERALHLRGAGPVWGKQGIAYVRYSHSSQAKVALVNPATGVSKIVASIPESAFVADLALSKTGRLAVLESQGNRLRVATYSSAYRETGSFDLPTGGHRACALAWSPDGTRLVVTGYGGAWMVDVAGTHWRRLPFRASSCTVSWR